MSQWSPSQFSKMVESLNGMSPEMKRAIDLDFRAHQVRHLTHFGENGSVAKVFDALNAAVRNAPTLEDAQMAYSRMKAVLHGLVRLIDAERKASRAIMKVRWGYTSLR